jgi:ribosomal protein L40E
MSSEKPGAAFILSLVGGLFVLLGGIVTAVIGAAFTLFIGGIGGILGVLGIVWGVLILVFASRLNSDPGSHSTSGALIIVFSVLSWVGAIGGFFIGFLLGLIGGILAITWTPQAQQPMQPMQPAAPVSAVQPGMKYCASCGAQMSASAGFCPKCGAKQF